jgi:hypothetical protein
MQQNKNSLSRKGLPTYVENPSILKMKTGQKPKPLTNANKAWVAEDTGECYDRAGLWEIQEVDNAPFVKLYVGAIQVFNDLTKTGAKILEVVFHELKQDNDKVYLDVHTAENYKIPRSTFLRGLKELCEKEILFESVQTGWYFINVNFIFNGDRLVIAKEYRRRRTPKIDDPNQLKLFETKN